MGKLRPFVRKDSYMPNKKWIPFVIGNGYTTTDGASGPAPEYETVTGNPVSFNAITPFPLRKLSVAFSPVQDLHGYDAPWPAGGGKNLLPPAEAKSETTNGCTVTSDGNGRFTISGTPSVSTEFTFNLSESFVIPDGSTYKVAFMNSVSNGNLIFYFYNNTTLVETWTMTPGNRVTTYSAMSGKTTNKVRISVPQTFSGTATLSPMFLLQTADASTFAPYSNLCPILGWDSLNVEQRGKNLLDQSSLTTTGITYSDGVLTGTAAAFNTAYGTSGNPIPISVGASRLTISLEAYTDGNLETTGGGIIFMFVHEDGTRTQAQLLNSTSEYAPLTVTSASGKTVVGIIITYGSNGGNIWHIRNLQLELGSTASPYQPYNGRSISISLGSTVYSGTVDVVTGVVTVDKASIDLGTIAYTKSTLTKGSVFRATISGKKAEVSLLICSQYKYQANGGFGGADMTVTDSESASYLQTIFITDTRYNDYSTAQFLAAMSGVQLVYELAEPLTIQLTPQEVESLAGDNTMWTDGDSLTVEYRSN